MAAVLRIDHCSDLVNQYAQVFRTKHIFQDFQKQYVQHVAYNSIDIEANQSEVERKLLNNSIQYISGSGHGRYELFLGNDGNPIWQDGQDFTVLKGKIIHLLSCQTGAVLGRSMVSHGAQAFWGYNVSFVFVHTDSPASLENDSLAEAFLRMDIIIDKGILAGKLGHEIYRSITQYVANVAPQLNAIHRGLLLSNYIHLACPAITWGDQDAAVA
jgi:hypothetical protein